jgi:hypothetical protein
MNARWNAAPRSLARNRLRFGDIRDIADQERPARRKQFDRGINELENARLDEVI